MALTVVTLVVLPGARGIMGRTGSLFPVVAVALVLHVVPVLTRRLRLAAGPLVVLAAYGAMVVWTVLPGTTFLGIPTAETLRALVDGLGAGVRALDTRLGPDLVEPAGVVQGRLLLAVASVGACAFMADEAAFRIRNPFLALVPSLSILLVGATRAPATNRSLLMALYLSAALGFALVHHTMTSRSSAALVQGRASAWAARVLPAGALIGVVAVAAALVTAPHLPGYGRPALVDIESSTVTTIAPEVPTGGVTINPLVDVTPNLVQRSNALMFTVASSEPAYWRLTSLDDFDGRVWKQGRAEFGGFAGDASEPGVPASQEFQIESLRGEWLPAAYRPEYVDPSIARIDRSMAHSLRPAGTLRNGLRYSVGSVLPRLSADRLALAPPSTADVETSRYLDLPSGLSSRVVAEAQRVVSGSGVRGPYESALVLQAYFRENFTYDLKAPAGHGEDALVRFLFRTRRGYCEQFAAAYAVMARSVGLPARVAVGFTPGELGPDGRFQVRGLNAHSWPEVFLQEVGWVAFEPTPGRGMPGAEGYTGLEPDQERFVPTPATDSTSVGTPDPTPAPTGTTVTTDPGDTTPTTESGDPVTTTTVAATPAPPSSGGSGGVAMTAAVVAVLAGAGVAVARALRRRHRRALAERPDELVVSAWSDAVRAMAKVGLGRRPAETMLAHAERAVADERLPRELTEPVLVLAGTAGTAAYSGRELDPAVAEEAGGHAAAIRSGLRRVTPLPRRITGLLR